MNLDFLDICHRTLIGNSCNICETRSMGII